MLKKLFPDINLWFFYSIVLIVLAIAEKGNNL